MQGAKQSVSGQYCNAGRTESSLDPDTAAMHGERIGCTTRSKTRVDWRAPDTSGVDGWHFDAWGLPATCQCVSHHAGMVSSTETNQTAAEIEQETTGSSMVKDIGICSILLHASLNPATHSPS